MFGYVGCLAYAHVCYRIFIESINSMSCAPKGYSNIVFRVFTNSDDLGKIIVPLVIL